MKNNGYFGNNPDTLGVVACCDGVKEACVLDSETACGDTSTGSGWAACEKNKCIIAHENFHKNDTSRGYCPSGNPVVMVPNTLNDQYCGERDAYTAEQTCLLDAYAQIPTVFPIGQKPNDYRNARTSIEGALFVVAPAISQWDAQCVD